MAWCSVVLPRWPMQSLFHLWLQPSKWQTHMLNTHTHTHTPTHTHTHACTHTTNTLLKRHLHKMSSPVIRWYRRRRERQHFVSHTHTHTRKQHRLPSISYTYYGKTHHLSKMHFQYSSLVEGEVYRVWMITSPPFPSPITHQPWRSERGGRGEHPDPARGFLCGHRHQQAGRQSRAPQETPSLRAILDASAAFTLNMTSPSPSIARIWQTEHVSPEHTHIHSCFFFLSPFLILFLFWCCSF